MVEDKMVGSPEKFNPFKDDRGTRIGNPDDGLYLRFTKEVGQPSLVEIETPETPLQKLELLLDALTSRSESLIRMDVLTPFGRSEIRRSIKRVLARLHRVPQYLETEFAADELSPTEQSLMQSVREVVAKQVTKLTGVRNFVGMMDFTQARARAAEHKQESDPSGSTTLDRFTLPTLRWVRNGGVLFGALTATGAAAQGSVDLNTTDKTIDLGQNFPEYEENEERSSFEKEMAQLIADIGSIESFIERLEESIGAVDIEATRVNFEPNVVEVSSRLLQEIQPTPSPSLEATSTPTQDANVRTGPGTDFEDEGDVHTNVQIIVMGSAINDGVLWYEVVAPNPDGSRVRGWVRHDLLSEPSKQVADVTEVINLPVRNSEGGNRLTLNEFANSQEPDRQVTEFANIKTGLDLYRPILPAGTFDPGNLEIGSVDGRVIFQVNDINYINSDGQEDTNEAGSMIAISFLPGTEPGQEDREFITPAFFGPGQYSKVLTEQAGVGGLEGGRFDGFNSASGYVRFGSNVIFNYEQATLALMTNVPQEQALVQSSIVLRDGSFPASNFTVEGDVLVFETGERFDLALNGLITEAKRVEGITNPRDTVLNPNISEVFNTSIPNDVLLREYNPIVGGYATESNGSTQVYREIIGADVEVTDQFMAGNIPVTLEQINGQQAFEFAENMETNGTAGIRQLYLEIYKKAFEVDDATAAQMLSENKPFPIHIVTDARDFANSSSLNANNSIVMYATPSAGISVMTTRDLPFPHTGDNIAFDNTFTTIAWGANPDGSNNPIVSFGYVLRVTEQGRIVIIAGSQAPELSALNWTSFMINGFDHLLRSTGEQRGRERATPDPSHETNYTKKIESSKRIAAAFNFPATEESRSFTAEQWNSRALLLFSN